MMAVELLDVDIPEPNEALTALLISPRMRAIVYEIAELAEAIYQEQVAKRTGRLAASANAHTSVGGKHHDRWVGELTVGGLGSAGTVEYAAAHEFGRGTHPQSIKHLDRPGGFDKPLPPAHDLNRVLEELGAF